MEHGVCFVQITAQYMQKNTTGDELLYKKRGGGDTYSERKIKHGRLKRENAYRTNI